MSEIRGDRKSVLAMAPKPEDFCRRVKELAEDTRNVKWSTHARERMAERDISLRVALSVIQDGFLVGAILAGKMPGEWKAKLVRKIPGRRDAGVVFLLVRNSMILVKTVEWEDMR